MKKLIYLTAVLLAISSIFISCEKTDPADDNTVDTGKKETLLTQYKTTTPLSVNIFDISYNSSLELDKLINKEQGVITSVNKYNYNGSLLTDCKKYGDEAMTNPIGSVTYSFNASSELTSMVDIDGADTTNYTISWSAGKISEYVAINNSAPFNDSKSVFEWTGDNITKETVYMRDSTGAFVSIGYQVNTYDDKINPLTIKYIPELDVMLISKNNILKTEYFGPAGNIQSISQFTYTYDDKNMPTTGTFDYGYISGTINFTYSDLSKE